MVDVEPALFVPHEVHLDAWTGQEPAAAPLSGQRGAWAIAPPVVPRISMLAPTPLDPTAWWDPRLGWGLILPERPGLEPAQLATADDAPEPIRDLFRARADLPAKLLRYQAERWRKYGTLRDYTSGGGDRPLTAPLGTQPGGLPAYLLIAASPAEVPWQVQSALNPARYVGRLDLDPDGLARYVSALLSGWAGSQVRYDSPVVWSVDHGGEDITVLMRDAIGDPLYQAFRADNQMPAASFVDGRMVVADTKALRAALVEHHPAVVVTTSHGMTGPLDQPAALAAQLGALVDAVHQPLRPEDLLADWSPDGAVWFAQACCSAGATAPSLYQGLFDPDSMVARVLDGVATVGPRTAPLPRALLGATRPLRAFIGHVEPTFDWTMAFPPTRQRLTGSLRTAIYTELCAGRPAGYAMAGVYDAIGPSLFEFATAVRAYSDNPPGPASDEALDLALYHKVVAYDRASTVLLGDPTVAMPVPAG
ncbi:MAG TPA: hypothetical protein VF163_08570 [Micromonosporaceae bacterium]